MTQMFSSTARLPFLSLLLIAVLSSLVTQRVLFKKADDEDIFTTGQGYPPSQTVNSTKGENYASVVSYYFNNLVTTEEFTFDGADVNKVNRRRLKENDVKTGKSNFASAFFKKNLRQNPNDQNSNYRKNSNSNIPKQKKNKVKPPTPTATTREKDNFAVNAKDSFYSPSNGTDIITHPIAMIKCNNQTMCIQPKLQLQSKYDVYYCKHVGHGVRFYFLAKEGLLLHPNIRMIEDIDKADMIVYLPVSAPWHKSECNKPQYKSKTIVLDEGDGPQLFEPDGTEEYRKRDWLMYFKRSYVRRHNGAFKEYMGYVNHPNVFPMSYTVVEAYVKTVFNKMVDRNLDIVCTLRGSNSDPTRLRVRQWIQDYVQARGIKKYVAGQVNDASRTVVSTDYLTQMFRAKIIVTSNPSDWEGDFRLMEAMASGALIFVDRMFVPRPYPLIEGLHIVYYDNNNKTDIFEKLDYYRKNLEISRRVAVSGYLHAMKYHRAANLMDYVFRTVELKLALADQKKKEDGGRVEDLMSTSIPIYTDTGYDMRKQALAYRDNQKKHGRFLKISTNTSNSN